MLFPRSLFLRVSPRATKLTACSSRPLHSINLPSAEAWKWRQRPFSRRSLVHPQPFASRHQRNFLHKSAPTSSGDDFKPTPPDQDPSLAWKRDAAKFNLGPDQVIPSTTHRAWNIEGAVKLSKLGTEPYGSIPPISIPTLFKRRVDKVPNSVSMAVKREGNWQKWTYENYYEDCWHAAKGFIALGLQRFHGVAILGFNSPEWVISNIAGIMAGGTPVGIYTTNSAGACAYIMKDSRANICVVENEMQLSKILQYKQDFPHLKTIIQYAGRPGADGVLSWDQFLEIGAGESDTELQNRLKHMAVNQCCSLIYTSGTTGNPKGVMLSHDNLTWLAHETARVNQFEDEHQEMVSYLPLSHVAAQNVDIYIPLYVDGTLYFADPDALKGTLINTLREVQPTVFLGVPRVWEKIYEGLQNVAAQNKGLKRKLGSWAKKQAVDYNHKRAAGYKGDPPLAFKLADHIILSRVRHALGLGRCNLAITAAAPMSLEMLEYFQSLNIVIGEAYGLSECSGPHTVSIPKLNIVRFGSIGKNTGSVVSKLDQLTEDGQGELCCGGRHVLMGYLNNEQATLKAIDDEGWLHSEDMSRIDEDGYIFITGRIKELLITAGGENVAPVPIEDNIKAVLPVVSNVMVIGDKLKFLSALLTFKTEMDPNTSEPKPELTALTKKWMERNGGCKVDTIKDVMAEVYEKQNSKLINAINSAIMLANTKSVSRASKVRKWVILPRDFSLPGGELGPSLKLRRPIVLEKYKDVIDEIYKDGTLDPNSTGALG